MELPSEPGPKFSYTLPRIIARMLPKSVIYWAFVTVATTDQGGRVPYMGDLSERTCIDAQKAWNK